MRVELAPRRVQGRDAGVAAARDVDGRQVERQAEQVVAQRLGDELVDLVADLAGHAADDGAGRLVPASAPLAANASGLRKACDQADLLDRVDRLKFGSKRSTVSVSIEWPKR